MEEQGCRTSNKIGKSMDAGTQTRWKSKGCRNLNKTGKCKDAGGQTRQGRVRMQEAKQDREE